MEKRIDFLIKAIEEVQETNRFLDTKAGAIAIFETFLLTFFFANLADESIRTLIQQALDKVPLGYLILSAANLIAVTIALLVHILLNLQVIFPSENPAEHVNLGDFKPTGLFFLYRLDDKKRVVPSIKKYSKQLQEMSEEEILEEYIFELMKLSYIRTDKARRLKKSIRFLEWIFLSMVVFWMIIGIGFLIYT